MKLLIASNNPGKLKEMQEYASRLSLDVLSPSDLGLNIDVVEDGVNFKENATKKVEAFLPFVDSAMYVVGDDSGIEIPALGGKPGVYTRRWAGHEMTDQEIVDYCLDKMKNFKGEDRRAVFKTVLALGRGSKDMVYFEGELTGYITEAADPRPIKPGLPFRNIFYITGIKKMLYDIHDPGVNVKTHRQIALQKVFDYLENSA